MRTGGSATPISRPGATTGGGGRRTRGGGDPKDGDAYGVLGDAHLELGHYDRAGEAYDAMMRLKSDLASYGRRAGLKHLLGGPAGAIDDLHRAVASGRATGQPRESIAWAQSQLGAEHVA